MHSEYRLKYDAQTGQVYKIWIVTILLSILTLGIYRFWGKTRLRRYTTSGFSLYSLQDPEYIGEDRFEYTGTGGELFKGFLKALFFLMVISIPFFWASFEMTKIHEAEFKAQLESNYDQIEVESYNELTERGTNNPIWNIESGTTSITNESESNTHSATFLYITSTIFFVYLLFYIAFLPFVAIFQALKYRASRLRFRGIRGHLVGSSIKYGLFGLFHALLTIITIGLWKPFADLSLHKYKMNRLYFGNQNAHFNAPYIKIFFYYFLWYLFFIVGAMIFILGNFFETAQAELLDSIREQLNNEHLFEFLIAWSPIFEISGALLLLIGAIGIFFGYRAALDRAKYNHLNFGDIGFKCNITGYKLFKLKFINTLIIIFTLGIGLPWAMQRNHRFLAQNLRVTGNFGQSRILQATGQEDTSGEGLFSFFDLQIKMF